MIYFIIIVSLVAAIVMYALCRGAALADNHMDEIRRIEP